MKVPTMIRSISKKLGIGRSILRLRRALQFGIRVEIATFISKKRYLRSITKARPLAADDGLIDCFMLLNEARFWEGAWALYSFRMYFGPCRMVVLDDGTLGNERRHILKALLPGILIPDVAGQDAMVFAHLEAHGLSRCLDWRKRFVFFRKLIDPCLLAENRGMVLLDSDCLHFRVPEEVCSWAENPEQVLFIADLEKHSFCAPSDVLSRICGVALPEFFCAGYLCIPREALQLKRIEKYLAAPCFLQQQSTGKFSHVAEQTLQAMEAAVYGTKILPLPYATCPDIPGEGSVAGHFCGGAVQRTWFYTKGLRFLANCISCDRT